MQMNVKSRLKKHLVTIDVIIVQQLRHKKDARRSVFLKENNYTEREAEYESSAIIVKISPLTIFDYAKTIDETNIIQPRILYYEM